MRVFGIVLWRQGLERLVISADVRHGRHLRDGRLQLDGIGEVGVTERLPVPLRLVSRGHASSRASVTQLRLESPDGE
jgi:hypothetical protein